MIYTVEFIIRSCGDYFNKPEPPEVRTYFGLVKIGPIAMT